MSQKRAGQPKSWPRPPPRAGPAAVPMPVAAETTPMPVPRRSAGNSLVIARIESTGMAAAPTPITMRPSTSTSRLGASAQTRLPTA
ncbi:hypothetical protein [Streptomyces sp. B8F3]|uniref:hypothetical protein n=1 Tax=unclassified Streptomyces TaxID=2593676 RepID=UPI00325E3BB8